MNEAKTNRVLIRFNRIGIETAGTLHAKTKGNIHHEKYIFGYRFENGLNRKKSTQRECWQQMNDRLISLGYEPKKSPTSIHRIWDVPFHNLDVEELDDFYGDILYL